MQIVPFTRPAVPLVGAVARPPLGVPPAPQFDGHDTDRARRYLLAALVRCDKLLDNEAWLDLESAINDICRDDDR